VGINVILAVSLNLITGYTGQFSLGHAGFMSVGAYLSAAVTLYFGPRLFGDGGGTAAQQGLLFFGALIAGGLAAAVAGLLVGVPSLRLRGDYLALVTLGFGEIIRVIFQNIDALGGALGLNGIPPYTTIFWVLAFAAVTVFTVVCLVHSTYGRGFLATRDDEIAAEAAGLNTTYYKIVAFVVGAFFVGVAGGLYGHFKLTITPSGFDFTKSIEIVVMVILGGMGNTLGVILAAVLLTLLPEFLRPVAEYRMVLYSLILIVLMILRPQGLFNFKIGKGRTI
jgi:branched-chain amino acid transport system permease protein